MKFIPLLNMEICVTAFGNLNIFFDNKEDLEPEDMYYGNDISLNKKVIKRY